MRTFLIGYFRGIKSKNPKSHILLQGDKDKGTDVHSLTAKSVGLDRQKAKVLNYARLYGCGQTKAQVMLGGRNHENRKMVEQLWKLTKGETAFTLVPEVSNAMEDVRLMLDQSSINPAIKKKFLDVYINDLSGKNMDRLSEVRSHSMRTSKFLKCVEPLSRLTLFIIFSLDIKESSRKNTNLLNKLSVRLIVAE